MHNTYNPNGQKSSQWQTQIIEKARWNAKIKNNKINSIATACATNHIITSNIINNVTDNGKNIKFTLEDKREFSDHEIDMKIIRAFQHFKWNAAELQDDILFTRDLEPVNRLGEIYVYVVGPDPTLEWDGDDIVVNSRISKKHFLVKKNKIDEFNAQCIYFFELPIQFSSRSSSNMQAVDG